MASTWDDFPYKLFLDDSRMPEEDDWVVVRTMSEAMETVERLGVPTEIILDPEPLRGGGSGAEFALWIVSQWRRSGREQPPKWKIQPGEQRSFEQTHKVFTRFFGARRR